MVPDIVPSYRDMKENTIPEFFKGRCVFVTGGTGFVGKVVIEKLLQSCSDVDTIYILIRGKRGKSVTERIEELFSCEIFSKLKVDWRTRVKIIEGELGSSSMMWNSAAEEELIERVNVVLHCAATVRFDEELEKAIAINVKGTSDVITLCKKMRNLKAVVHVSTAYSSPNKGVVREQFHPTGMTPEIAMGLTYLKEKNILRILTPKIISGWSNAYTYTKCMAENLVRSEGKNLPISIFRPGIIVGTTDKNSAPGYVDNINGPNGLALGIGLGVVRTIYLRGELPSHAIPGDLCANAILAAAWRTGTEPCSQKEPIIYNYVPESGKGVSWSTFIFKMFEQADNHPMKDCVWINMLSIIPNRLVYILISFFIHTLPALFIDMLLFITGKKPKLSSIYRKIHKNADLLIPFMVEGWKFEVDNTKELENSLPKSDAEDFNLNLSKIDWDRFSCTLADGIRFYLAKDLPSDLEHSRQRYFKMKLIHNTLKYILVAILMYALWNTISYRLLGAKTTSIASYY